WKESITPDAKPAMRRPPISIGAAAPTIECVAFTLKEIRIRKKQPRKTPSLVGPTAPDHITTAASASTTLSRKYRAIATGERWPRKNLSETHPEIMEPATAINGIMFKVHMTEDGLVLRSRPRYFVK